MNMSSPIGVRVVCPVFTRFLVGLAIVFLSAATVRRAAAQEEAFRSGMLEVRRLMDDLDWANAKSSLLTLLKQHQGNDYVLLQITEIREDLERCAVRMAIPEPDPGSMIAGYAGYNRKSGQIDLRLRPGDLGNFEPNGPFLLHPVTFAGNYSIELKGKSYGAEPTLLVCLRGDEGYVVSFGFHKKNRSFELWQPATIHRLNTAGKELLDKVEKPPLRQGKTFRLKVTVDLRRITVTANGRRLLSAKKTVDEWGQFGVFNLGDFAEIKVTGKANSSWIEGLIDEKGRAAEQEFLKTYDVETELPDWLRDAAKPSPTAENPESDDLPWRLLPNQIQHYNKVAEALTKGEPENAVQIIAQMKPTDLPTDLRDYLLVVAYSSLDAWLRALPICEGVVRRNQDFVQGRLLYADLLSIAGRPTESLTEYRAAITLAPRRSEAYRKLIQLQMLAGEIEEARKTVLEANRAGARDETILKVSAVLSKAARGPNWGRVFEHETPHYSIRSNLDNTTSQESGKVLEDAFLRYEKELGPLPSPAKERKAKVFLFSGEAGYQEYTSGLFDAPPHNTAGVYSPSLKQLLIWNLPNRNDMMETVRHEAVHQYLDALGTDPPTWFGEGLAQYLSYLKRDNLRESFRLGEVDGEQARFVKRYVSQLVPLKQFLYLEGKVFYLNGQLLYPQSWSFIHFLRHSDPANRKIYEKLLRSVLKGDGKRECVETAFAEIDLERLDEKYKDYVRGLEE